MQVSVYVGEQKLREYDHEGATYIAVDLYSEKAFTVEEQDELDGRNEPCWQKYTLNPFLIKVEKECLCPVFLKVKVDGEVIQCRPYGRGRKTIDINKIKYQNTLREMVFSLPRLTAKTVVPETRKEQLGTVEVIMEEATQIGFHRMPSTTVHWEPCGVIPAMPCFPQASKGDISHLLSNGNRTIVARDGRMVGRLVQDTNKMVSRPNYRQTGRILAQKMLYYRCTLVLQEMGVIPRAPLQPSMPPGPGGDGEKGKPCSNKEEPDHSMTEDTVKAEDMVKMEDSVLEDSLIIVRVDLPTVKRERDASMICMGDQDCFVVDKDLSVIHIDSDMEEDGTQ